MAAEPANAPRSGVPLFELDPSWPRPLPNNWVLGMVASVAVDARDHVWILHRPGTVPAERPIGEQGPVAPPVIEFDRSGNVMQAWGGPNPSHNWMEASTAPYPMGSPAEHGLFVDHAANVWVTGNGHIVLKFTSTGKFLLQVGEFKKTAGSDDTRLLGNPTDMTVDPDTNELFVADGYLNRRVIVFDAETGAYKRHWGAYGKQPDDGPVEPYEPDQPLPRQFFAVHGLLLARDGMLYVCDRQRNRIQVFTKDGTFVTETVVAKDTPAGMGAGTTGWGSTFRVGISDDREQRYLYVADLMNAKVWILERRDLALLGSFECRGIHHIAGADSEGNLYASGGRSPQRFLFKGVSEPAARR